MFRATTPTHIFTLPFDTVDVKKVRITYQQDGVTVLQKTESDCVSVGKEIAVTLSQDDTKLFAHDNRASVQLRVLLNTGIVMASDIEKVLVKACLDEEVLSE